MTIEYGNIGFLTFDKLQGHTENQVIEHFVAILGRKIVTNPTNF